jgi:hypothetical protein
MKPANEPMLPAGTNITTAQRGVIATDRATPCGAQIFYNLGTGGDCVRWKGILFAPGLMPELRAEALRAAAPRVTAAAAKALRFLADNFSDADMPDILPELRAAIAAAGVTP